MKAMQSTCWDSPDPPTHDGVGVPQAFEAVNALPALAPSPPDKPERLIDDRACDTDPLDAELGAHRLKKLLTLSGPVVDDKGATLPRRAPVSDPAG